MLEVRDKPVSHDDLRILATRAADNKIGDAIMVAVANGQPELRLHEARAWAAQKGVALTVFLDWGTLVRQILLWSAIPSLEGARSLPRLVQDRLVSIQAPEVATESWAARFMQSR